jgi:hypothetical protein
MTNFMDIIHRLMMIIKNTRRFGEWNLSPSSGNRGGVPTLMGPIERASLNLRN